MSAFGAKAEYIPKFLLDLLVFLSFPFESAASIPTDLTLWLFKNSGGHHGKTCGMEQGQDHRSEGSAKAPRDLVNSNQARNSKDGRD
jgi:hypothetical protein